MSKQTRGERKARRRRVLEKQQKAAAIRAKYGPSRRPAPVVVRSLDTGAVLVVKDQSRFGTKRYSPSLETRAKQEGYSSYRAYLRSPHWLGFRETALSAVGYKCQRCPRKDNLSVHHLGYEVLGNERLKDVLVLCPACHRKTHSH